jgi:radical SAM superfamily enzyme YgiQ (UPF0313 family)
LNWKLKKEIIDVLNSEKGFKLSKKGGDVKLLFIYPNAYNISINNLGYIGLYHIFNEQQGILCERAYIPKDWKNRKDFRIYSIEGFRELRDFDALLFSVSFELDFFNIIYILNLEKIPIYSVERDDSYPLIIGGGIALSSNPETISEIFDLILIGEGEEIVSELSEALILKKEKSWTKEKFLNAIKDYEGFYIPKFLKVTYNGKKIEKIEGEQKLPIRRRIYYNFSNNPMVSPITSYKGVFSDMALCELVRGCKYQCRFCLAGYFYRPYRVSSIEKIYEKINRFYEEDTPKLGFIVPAIDPSLSLMKIKDYVERGEILISFSSLRLEDITEDILDLIKTTHQKTITIAPETGTDRLRRVLNKKFTNNDILNFSEKIKDYKVKTLKLYFMIGLPTETWEDIEGILDLIMNIKKIVKKVEISISVSTFIPKPHTPFQWEKMADLEYIEKVRSYLLKNIRKMDNIKMEEENILWVFWQGVLSRGDRRLKEFFKEYIKDAYSLRILKKFMKDNLLKKYYLEEKEKDEIFPWSFIDTGVKREYLWKEREKAYQGVITLPCNDYCKACGVCL